MPTEPLTKCLCGHQSIVHAEFWCGYDTTGGDQYEYHCQAPACLCEDYDAENEATEPQNWADYYRSIGDDPCECSMYGCESPALYIIAGQPCRPGCDHMHGVPQPRCESHSAGSEIVETTGD